MIFFQCFGGYWNDVAHWADGWGQHLDTSCTIKVICHCYLLEICCHREEINLDNMLKVFNVKTHGCFGEFF